MPIHLTRRGILNLAKRGVKAYGIVILLENGTAKRFVGTGIKNSAHIEQTRMSAGKIYAVIKFFFFEMV